MLDRFEGNLPSPSWTGKTEHPHKSPAGRARIWHSTPPSPQTSALLFWAKQIQTTTLYLFIGD